MASSLSEAWPALEPEPTDLIVPWPGARAPRPDDIVRAPSPWTVLPRPGDGTLWCVRMEPPGRTAPIIVWAEPARTADGRRDDTREPAYVIGFESMLEGDAREDLGALMRLALDAVPDAPHLLDVNAHAQHERTALLDLLDSAGAGPPDDLLWSIEVMNAPAGAWLATSGLARDGRPELEMLEVPADMIDAAAEAIATTAAILLERPPPAPGGAVEIGLELVVALHPWERVAPGVAAAGPGGIDERRADPAGRGRPGGGAVICDADEDVERPVWPRSVVERIAAGDVALYRSERATARRAHLARARWAEAVRAVEVVPGAAIVVETPLEAHGKDAADDGGALREHLWYAALRVEPGRVLGRLVRPGVTGARREDQSDSWIEPARLSDWRVIVGERGFGPEDIHALRRLAEAAP